MTLRQYEMQTGAFVMPHTAGVSHLCLQKVKAELFQERSPLSPAVLFPHSFISLSNLMK